MSEKKLVTYRVTVLLLILLLLISTFSAGCIQTNRQIKSSNLIVGGITVTEVTYLYGSDGLFTKKYIVSGSFLGKQSPQQTYSRKEYEDAKNSPIGYLLPDF